MYLRSVYFPMSRTLPHSGVSQSQRSSFTFPGRSKRGFCRLEPEIPLSSPVQHQYSCGKQVLCGGRLPGGWGAPGPGQCADFGIGCPAPSRGCFSIGPLTPWGTRDTESRSVGPTEIRPLPLIPLRPGTLARVAPWEDSHRAQDAPCPMQLIPHCPAAMPGGLRSPENTVLCRGALSLGLAAMAVPVF